MSRNLTFVWVYVIMFCQRPMTYQPDIGLWTIPISWICLFLWIWVNERVFKRSVINLEHFASSNEKIRFLKFSKILKEILFPRQEINLKEEMILKLLSNTESNIKYDDRINDSPKWNKRIWQNLTFQIHVISKAWTRTDFPKSKRKSLCSTNEWTNWKSWSFTISI